MDKVPEKRGIREVQVRLVFGEHFLPFVWFREFPSVGCLYNDRFFSRELVITIHEACWMMLHKLPCGNRMITKPIALIEEFVSRVLRTIAMFTSLNLDIFNLYALSQLLCEALLLLLNAKDDSLVDCGEAVLHGFNENEELRHEGGVLPRFPVNVLVERFGLVATCSNTFSSKQGPWLYSFFAYVVNIPGVLGAILCGFGIATVFISNGSTGGWDIIAAVINKYRNISLGRVMLYIDIFIISSCYFIFDSWRMVVFGYVTLVVSNYTLDMIVNSTRQDIQFIIFTKDHVKLSERIINETAHSVTVIDSEGYYSHTPTKVMITIVHKNEAIHILRMIHEVDPNAFVSQSRAEGVYGNGFNKIKLK